jgi:hypothetical protein
MTEDFAATAIRSVLVQIDAGTFGQSHGVHAIRRYLTTVTDTLDIHEPTPITDGLRPIERFIHYGALDDMGTGETT